MKILLDTHTVLWFARGDARRHRRHHRPGPWRRPEDCDGAGNDRSICRHAIFVMLTNQFRSRCTVSGENAGEHSAINSAPSVPSVRERTDFPGLEQSPTEKFAPYLDQFSTLSSRNWSKSLVFTVTSTSPFTWAMAAI